MAATQVSMPSPTISTSPGEARRTTPPRQGPSIIFAGSTGALPTPSRARKVRWIARSVSSPPRITSATIAGQMPLEGCLSPAWKRSIADGGTCRPREARYVATGVPSAGTADCQMASAASVRLASSRSGRLLAATGGAGHVSRRWPCSSHSPRDRRTAITRSWSQPAWQRTSTLPSPALRIDRLGSRSSWAGQRAIHAPPDFRPPRALAMVSAFMAHLAGI